MSRVDVCLWHICDLANYHSDDCLRGQSGPRWSVPHVIRLQLQGSPRKQPDACDCTAREREGHPVATPRGIYRC
jgi:hypothetical protein